MFEPYPFTLGSSLALLTAVFLLHQVFVWRRDGLSHVPYHKFEHDDTPRRYVQDSEELVHSGYLKVGGWPFSVHALSSQWLPRGKLPR